LAGDDTDLGPASVNVLTDQNHELEFPAWVGVLTNQNQELFPIAIGCSVGLQALLKDSGNG